MARKAQHSFLAIVDPPPQRQKETALFSMTREMRIHSLLISGRMKMHYFLVSVKIRDFLALVKSVHLPISNSKTQQRKLYKTISLSNNTKHSLITLFNNYQPISGT